MNNAFLNTVKSINRADMSTTAKTVFIELMCNANQKKPLVFVDVKGLSESIGRAASTIRKAIRELVAKGFLIWEGLVVQLKHKIYKLIFDGVNQVKKSLTKTETKSSAGQPRDYGEVLVPVSRKAEYGELINCWSQFGLPTASITQLLATHKLEHCREMTLEFMQLWRVDNTLSPRVWFQRHLEATHR